MQPLARDLVAAALAKAGDLPESGHLLWLPAPDVRAMLQLQAADLRELGNALQPLARDLVAGAKVQAAELPESDHRFQHPVSDVLAMRPL